jgi:4-diphosphocytidyl-2-C-methyl-D-erythritol kinase
MTTSSRVPLVVDARAKINLHLEVLGKRSDGYHELESLFVRISLADTLTFRESPGTTQVMCGDAEVGPMEDNLVYRAVQLVRQESGIESGITIELTKRVPIAAGLGGGSSDAAATLQGLNEWWRLGWPVERLADLGARLGSDVPFFFAGPAAVVRGRGERVEPISPGVTLDLVLVTPTDRLSTRTVFGNLVPGGDVIPVEPIARALKSGDRAAVAAQLHNRLQDVSMALCPALRDIHDRAKAWPCLGHLMTGSGSTYFALCETGAQADELGRSLSRMGLGSVFVVRSG